MKTGITNEKTILVTDENTAKALGSGELDVFATPAMIALMEATASESVKECLENSETSVGTMINVKHISATPVGMSVRCVSELTESDGRKLLFSVKAYDEAGLIGEGEHERFIVNKEKFTMKTYGKQKK